MQTLLNIAATRSDHYTGIAKNISSISSRMAALENQFLFVSPRNPSDDAWIDLLIASANEMVLAAQALKLIEYTPVPPPPEPEPEI